MRTYCGQNGLGKLSVICTRLGQVSLSLLRITVTWRQVDTQVLPVLPVLPAFIFTFQMMNFDFNNAASSNLQRSPTGLVDAVSDIDALECNQVTEGFDSFQPALNAGTLQL